MRAYTPAQLSRRSGRPQGWRHAARAEAFTDQHPYVRYQYRSCLMRIISTLIRTLSTIGAADLKAARTEDAAHVRGTLHVCLRMSYTYCMLHACSSHFGVGSTYGACRILIPGIGLPSVVARLRRCNGCAICSAACCAVVCDSVACANGCDNLDEQLDHFLRADARSCAERRQPCQQATEQTLPPCVSTH